MQLSVKKIMNIHAHNELLRSVDENTLLLILNAGVLAMLIDYKVIGKRIKDCRKKAKLSQENLAEKLDISISFQSRLERGATKISFEKLVLTAEHLNVPVCYLISGVQQDSEDYLNADLYEITKDFSPDKMQLLLGIAEVISKT